MKIKKNKHKKYLHKNSPRLDGQTIIVTGATGGIGSSITVHLLNLGARVIIAARSASKGESFKSSLVQNGYDQNKLRVLPLDLSNPISIDNFVESTKTEPIHHIINNAGTLNSSAPCDRYETHYITNFLGPIYLSIKLAPILNKNENSKIIFQSSLSDHSAHIDWNDIQALKVHGAIKRYARSKRLLNQTIIALKESNLHQFPNVTYSLVHPGISGTDIINHKTTNFSKAFSVLGNGILKLICHSAQTAALPAVLAISKPIPTNRILGPRTFGVWGKPKLRKLDKKYFIKTEIEKATKNIKSELLQIHTAQNP